MSFDQFHAPTIISKKRDGLELSAEEIDCFVREFTAGNIPDSQMSALAMAVYFQGMDGAESTALTKAMLESGDQLNWPSSENRPPIVDKHSTGGIGDKVSLVLAPLLACAGSWVPMISGRGLGITGGTLDKLESIEGFRTDLSLDEIHQIVSEVGCVITGQTPDLCPADRKIYALRDVTGTVPSQPLIVASIMSKKLAESLDALVLDVKYGSGAFMKTREEANELAESMVEVGNLFGVRTSFLLNPMDQPLGSSVGNALEVIEAVDTLRGNGPPDLEETVVDLASEVSSNTKESLLNLLKSGTCFEKFREMVKAQGGNPDSLDSLAEQHRAPFVAEIKAEHDGVITGMNAERIGQRALLLGAGRSKPADKIYHAVGFDRIRKVGEKVGVGDSLIRIHARTLDGLKEAAADIREACEVEA